MNKLAELLEEIEDNQEVLIKFFDGECFGLSNFEMVDESIYQKSDICLADMESIISVNKDVYKVGNKYEFSINEIIEVVDNVSGDVLFRKPK